MAEHATLAASAAERWITCPASVGLARQVQEAGGVAVESSYAHEGTLAHELAYLHLSVAFGKITNRQFNLRLNKFIRENDLPDETFQEMTTHVMAFVNFVQKKMAEYPSSSVMFEQRLPSGIESCWGTSDVVIVSPSHVNIIDFKYGMGIPVDAHENPQLKIYALGALDEYGDLLGETTIVVMDIFQPRIDFITRFEVTPLELRDWREQIRPIAASALDGTGEFNPTEAACRWCPAAGICRARVEKFASIDFAGDPEMLTPEEIADYLGQLSEIRNWCDALDQAALDRAYTQGKEIPGWKVVLSGGRRVIVNEAAAREKLYEMGYETEEIINSKIKGIGDLESLLGKKTFAELLSPYIENRPGKPAMARADDKRPAISPETEAAKEFDDDDEIDATT